jgi:hypothetical protein
MATMASIWGDANITRVNTMLLAFEVKAAATIVDKNDAWSAYSTARGALSDMILNPTATLVQLQAAYDAVDATEKIYQPLVLKADSQTKALSMLRDLIMLMVDADALSHAFG